MKLIDVLADEKTLRSAWSALHKNPASQGIDDVTIDDFRDRLDTEITELSRSISSGFYEPSELRGHPLEKGKANSRAMDKKKYRILKIPTVRDRIVQKAIEQLVVDYLDAKYKIAKNGVSFAYMKNGGVDKAAQQVREYYREGNSYVYVSDIKSFFDEVDNTILLEKISTALPDKSLMKLIKRFLEIDIDNAQQVQERTLIEYTYNPMVGIAQGSPLSPLFANVYLAGLDQAAIKAKLKLVRYADDIVILCKTKEDAISAHDFVVEELRKLKLQVHPLLIKSDLPTKGHEKHSIVQKYSGLHFLGLRFSGEKIYPSAASFDNAIWTVRRAAYNRKLSFVKNS